MVFDKIKELLAEQFLMDVDEITMELSFVDDLGADSLDVVELVMAMEEAFDLPEIDEEALKSLMVVGDVVRYISAQLEE